MRREKSSSRTWPRNLGLRFAGFLSLRETYRVENAAQGEGRRISAAPSFRSLNRRFLVSGDATDFVSLCAVQHEITVKGPARQLTRALVAIVNCLRRHITAASPAGRKFNLASRRGRGTIMRLCTFCAK